MAVIPTGNALDTYKSIMDIRQKKLAYQKSQIELMDRQREIKEKYSDTAVQTRMLAQQTGLLDAYTANQKAMEDTIAAKGLGFTAAIMQVGENNFAKGAGSVPLDQAMQLQHDKQNDNSDVVINSVEAYQDILAGTDTPQDLRDRTNNMVLENGARAVGQGKLTPDTKKLTTVLTQSLFPDQKLDLDSEELTEVVDGSKLSGQLQQAMKGTLTHFQKIENQPNLSPTERMVNAAAYGVAELDLSPNETAVVLNAVIGNLDAMQQSKLSESLVKGSMEYSKAIEGGVAMMDQTNRQMLQEDDEVYRDQIVNQAGSYDLVQLMGQTRGVYGDDAVFTAVGDSIKKRQAVFNSSWDKTSAHDKFSMYTDAMIDTIASKSITLQQDYKINGAIKSAEMLKRANAQGTLLQEYPAVGQALLEGFQKFNAGQMSVMERMNEQVGTRAQAENKMPALAYNGKGVLWTSRSKEKGGDLVDAQIQEYVSDPQAFEVLEQTGIVAFDSKSDTYYLDKSNYSPDTMKAIVESSQHLQDISDFSLTETTVVQDGAQYQSRQTVSQMPQAQQIAYKEFLDNLSVGTDTAEGRKISKKDFSRYNFKSKDGDIDLGAIIKRDPMLTQLAVKAHGDPTKMRHVAMAATRKAFKDLDSNLLNQDMDTFRKPLIGLKDVMDDATFTKVQSELSGNNTETLKSVLQELKFKMENAQSASYVTLSPWRTVRPQDAYMIELREIETSLFGRKGFYTQGTKAIKQLGDAFGTRTDVTNRFQQHYAEIEELIDEIKEVRKHTLTPLPAYGAGSLIDTEE